MLRALALCVALASVPASVAQAGGPDLGAPIRPDGVKTPLEDDQLPAGQDRGPAGRKVVVPATPPARLAPVPSSEPSAQAAEASEVAAQAVAVRPSRPHRSRPGLALAIGGATVAVAAAAVLGAGASLFGGANDAPTLDERNRRLDVGRAEQVGGGVALGVGLAALAGGAFLLSLPRRDAPHASLWIAPNGGGVAARGSF